MSDVRSIFTRNFLLIWAASFFFAAICGIQIVLPKFIKHQGGLVEDIGVIMAAYTGVSVFARPLVGSMLGTVGNKVFLVAGAVLLLASLFLYALPWPAALFLLVPRLVQGLGVSCFSTACENFMAGELPQDRLAQGMAFFMLSGMSTAAFAPSLAEWIAEAYGYRALFLLMALACVLVVAAVYRLSEQTEMLRRTKRMQEFRSLLREPVLWMAVAVSLLFTSGRVSYDTFLPVYGLARGLPTVGTYYLFYTIGAVIVRVFFVQWADRWEFRRVLVPSLLLHAVAIAGLYFADLDPTLHVAGFLGGLAHGLFIPTMAAYLVKRCRTGSRGLALGLLASARDVGNSGASVGYGYLVLSWGYGAMWMVGALVTVLAAALISMERRFLSRFPAPAQEEAAPAPEIRDASEPTSS